MCSILDDGCKSPIFWGIITVSWFWLCFLIYCDTSSKVFQLFRSKLVEYSPTVIKTSWNLCTLWELIRLLTHFRFWTASLVANCRALSPLSPRSVTLQWKLYPSGSCRRCCCAVRPVPSPSTGTVIKSLSEKLGATQNMFSIVKGSFYSNIFKYSSIWIATSIVSIDVLNVSFSGEDIFWLFHSYIKSTKCVIPEQIAWINVLYDL